MNEELLKGIQARERVVQLKKIIATDSHTISLYRDSIVPAYDTALKISKKSIIKLNQTIEKKDKEISIYRYFSGILSIASLTLLLIL